MFEVRRMLGGNVLTQPCGYKVGVYGDVEDIEAAIGSGAVKAGDAIMTVFYRHSQGRYGYVNSSNAIVLTPQ